jgi:predicted DNA-binding transcriptional regulator YafY
VREWSHDEFMAILLDAARNGNSLTVAYRGGSEGCHVLREINPLVVFRKPG